MDGVTVSLEATAVEVDAFDAAAVEVETSTEVVDTLEQEVTCDAPEN